MIKKIEIENYKSLENLSMELGRFNVLIGENGCGKTNILESLVFAAAGANGIIENNFLTLRGGRISEAKFFRSGFEENSISQEINIILFNTDDSKLALKFVNDNQPFSKWQNFNSYKFSPEINQLIDRNYAELTKKKYSDEFIFETEQDLKRSNAASMRKTSPILNFIIYLPENTFLRNINIDVPYIDPVGSRGEGVLKLIKVIKKERPDEYVEIMSHLHLIDWFENFDINEDFNADNEFTLSDKYLEEGLKSFDIRNANEGFLFVLFYLTIFISDYTPKFFAIDNIDTALNPKLCSKLISVLAELAKKHDKQVIITTHNPSVLDGLNLTDDEQRLFVISRNKSGRTKATRIEKKPAINGTEPVKLSEQFLRGYIGGLPKNF